jgi:hypothetical protein
MVNNRSTSPLYDLSIIQQYVMQDSFELVTDGAQTSYKELAWKTADFKAIISCLDVSRHFRGIARNMQTNIGLIDVDKYRIFYDEDCKKEDRRNGLEFFFKLALDPECPQTVVISVHLSR